MARKNTPPAADGSADPGVVLVPPRTAFDFLEGAFTKSERSRMGGIMLIGACTVALAGSVTLGGLSAVATQLSADELTSAQGELTAVTSKLAQLDSVEGIPASQIRSHVQQRTAALKDAYGDEVDSVGLLGSISASAPGGVQVTGITFSGTGASADQKSDAAEDTGSSTVSVTGTATSFGLLTQWQAALGATPGLSEVDMTWTGAADAVQVTVTATVTDDALSARARALSPQTSEGGQ